MKHPNTLLSFAIAAALGLVASSAGATPGNGNGAIERAQAHLNGAAHGAAAVADGDQFLATDVIVDAKGKGEHVRFAREYKGLRVIGGDIVVHSNGNGAFQSVSHTMRGALNLGTTARLDRATAIANAESAFDGIRSGASRAELVVNARGAAANLAYEVLVSGDKFDGTPSEMHFVIDANSGAIQFAYDGVETAASAGTGKTLYSGTVALTTDSQTGGFALRDPSRGNQYTVTAAKGKTSGSIFTDADNVWGNFTNADAATAAADAQFGTAVTWDYFKNVHGRNGIANDGRGAYNQVHYGRNYVNAYWSDSCFCMTYGDGDGVTYGPLVNLDVAGHEMSHGVTSRSANLTYSGESGGLNEATSDIFGTMVEYYANNTSDAGDYLIGEKIYLSNPNGTKALRFMFKPSLDGGRSPDCYSSTIGSLDVHYSSGVANHFYYLLAEGQVVPSNFPSVTTSQLVCNGASGLKGVGRDAASKIWYRALTVYMTSGTNYKGARTATLAAAADLDNGGTTLQNAVAAAWSAVGVN